MSTKLQPAQRRTAVVVLGMHRSGTSAVSGLLRAAGLGAPKDSIPADEHNEKGYWESASVVAINEEILAASGGSTDDCRRFDLGKLSQTELRAYQSRIASAISDAFEGHKYFVLKDPRICRMVPLYDSLLRDLEIDPAYLLVLRNPSAVAASLSKRDHTQPSFATLLWLRHVIEAEFFTRGKKRFFVHYEDVLKAPGRMAQKIGDQLGLPISKGKLRSAISADLAHSHQAVLHDVTTPLFDLAKKAYAGLTEFAAGQEGAAIFKLDACRDELNSAANLVADALYEEMEARQARLRNSIAYFSNLSSKRQEYISTLEGRIAGSSFSKEAEGNELRSLCEAQKAEISRLSLLVSTTETQMKATKETLQRARRKTVQSVALLNREKGRNANLTRQLEEQAASIAAVRSEVRRLQQIADADRHVRDALLRELDEERKVNSRPPRALRWIGPRFRKGANALVAHPIESGEPPTRQTVLDERTRNLIEASGLFDPGYYAERYASSIENWNDLLADFISAPAGTRDPNTLFCSQYYYRLHPDVAQSGMNPLIHFVKFGIDEGRMGIMPSGVQSFLMSAKLDLLCGINDILGERTPLTILVSEEGNFFFSEIASYLVDFLRERGRDVELAAHPPPAESGRLRVVVAPHEYFLSDTVAGWTPDEVASAAYVNTEQWQTPWFAKCYRQLVGSTVGVLDINPSSAAGLAKLGQRAAFLPLLPIPGSIFEPRRQPLSASLTRTKFLPQFDYAASLGDRVIDLTFVGVRNERRAEALARLAPVLADSECFIHCPAFDKPILESDPDILNGSDFTQICMNSKILLNIHRDDIGYLEWHRILLYGVINGCAVITEPCIESAFIKPNVNYIEANINDMPNVVYELLRSEKGMEKLHSISENNKTLYRQILDGERFQI